MNFILKGYQSVFTQFILMNTSWLLAQNFKYVLITLQQKKNTDLQIKFFFVWEIFNILYFFSGAYLGPGNQSFARLLIVFLHFFKFEYMLFNILWIKYLYLKKMHNLWLQHFNFGCKHSIFCLKSFQKCKICFWKFLISTKTVICAANAKLWI